MPVEEQRIHVPGQSIAGKMKLNKYKAEAHGDSDTVAQNTPKKTSHMVKQSSMPSL